MNRNDQGMDRMHTMNGKRGPPSQRPRDLPRELPRDIPRDMSRDIQREVPHSQHDAIINYILDSWNTVYSEVQQGTQGNGNVGYYHEPNFKLKGELNGDLMMSSQPRETSQKRFRYNRHRT